MLHNWRAFRAGLVASEQPAPTASYTQQRKTWLHQISKPEAGCLLLARQPDLGFFARSIVLVLKHDCECGTQGLVLNRRAALCIDDLHIQQETKDAFGARALHLGGPVNYSTIHLLHGQQHVQDACQVCPGIYTGGLASASSLVQSGRLNQSDFCVLAGYTGWRQHQLEEEIHDHAWLCVSASPDLVLSIVLNQEQTDPWEELLHLTQST